MRHIDYTKFKKEFLETDIGQQVKKDFANITCSNHHWPSVVVAASMRKMTPRQLIGDINTSDITPTMGSFSIVPFYYINQLLEKNPKEIYDIGCGWNIFKQYIPEIIGIDDNSLYADRKESYDAGFISKNERQFKSLMSINMSWHMGPNGETTNLINLKDHIKEFARLVAPGGRCFLSVSALGVLHYTPREWYNQMELNPFDVDNLTWYVEKQLIETGLDIICMDTELDTLYNMPDHDGEIRIVFNG